MSAIAVVLAGLELTAGAEPTPIITKESDLPRSAICHITRATLVPTGTGSTTAATFYLKAAISDSQDVVLAAISSSQPSVGLDLVFHADSEPMFSVTSVPESKADAKQKFTVHLSGYVDVEEAEDDGEGDDDDEDSEDELTPEEMAEMRAALKRGEFGEEDDDDEDDQEGGAEGMEDDDEGGEEEEEEEEEKQAAPAASKKGASAAAKRKQSPTKETAPAPAAKQQKTAPTTAAASTKQAKSAKGSDKPATTAAASASGATILPSGLTIQDEVVGTGAEANNGRKVSIRYRGQLVSNGKVFDTNMPKGQPFAFTLGGGECIEGFDKGVKGMRVGGRRVIVVPSELGYGKRGSPPSIPPNAALKFTIELLKA